MGACFFTLFITFIFFTTRFVVALNRYTKKRSHQLPPGPPSIPFFGNLLWLLIKPFSRVKALFLSLHERYGPIYTLYIGSKPLIVIASHSLAHQALIDNSVIFADRPQAMATDKFLSCDQHNISSAFHTPYMAPTPPEPIQYALYSLFAFIGFGEKLEDKKIQDIKDLQRCLQLSFDEFKVLNMFPCLGKFVFLKRWEKLRQLRQDQEKLM
ncbi:hypothetical protein Gotur_003744, partial [Gossypium turneri]